MRPTPSPPRPLPTDLAAREGNALLSTLVAAMARAAAREAFAAAREAREVTPSKGDGQAASRP